MEIREEIGSHAKFEVRLSSVQSLEEKPNLVENSEEKLINLKQ